VRLGRAPAAVRQVILVDPARWPWRGRLWAHLVSDRDYAELHEFALRLGLRRVGFQGDHYDVDEATRARAIELGADPVTSRELLRRLRDGGLRLRGPRTHQRWRWVADEPLALLVDRPPAAWPAPWAQAARHLSSSALEKLVEICHETAPDAILRLLSRPGELAAVVLPRPAAETPPLAELVVVLDGEDWR
jgi:hypothetical protein